MADALKAVPNNVDWHWWVKIGAALFDALADDGEDLFIAWSAQSPKDDPEYTRRKWRSFRKSAMTTTAASLFWLARQNGWRPASETGGSKSTPQGNRPLGLPTAAQRRGQHRAAGGSARTEPQSSRPFACQRRG